MTKIFTKRNRIVITMLGLLLVAGISACWWVRTHQGPQAAPLTSETVTAGPPHYLMTINGKTKPSDPINSAKSLDEPLAVAVSANDIFVSDTGRAQIQVYNRQGEWISTWGQGKLNYPFALAYGNNSLYIADPTLMELFVYDAKGNEQRPLLNKQRLQLTNGKQGEIIRPAAVQIGTDHLIYVADVGNQVILVMNDNGKILRYFGGAGTADGKFQYPNALYVAKDGKIYVSDSNNSRIEIFDRQGQFLNKITGLKGKDGPLALPRGVAVTDSGIVLVVDVFTHSLRAYNPDGAELWFFGGNGTGNTQFNFPNGLAIDAQGRIYVTDRENNRVQVLGY